MAEILSLREEVRALCIRNPKGDVKNLRSGEMWGPFLLGEGRKCRQPAEISTSNEQNNVGAGGCCSWARKPAESRL